MGNIALNLIIRAHGNKLGQESQLNRAVDDLRPFFVDVSQLVGPADVRIGKLQNGIQDILRISLLGASPH